MAAYVSIDKIIRKAERNLKRLRRSRRRLKRRMARIKAKKPQLKPGSAAYRYYKRRYDRYAKILARVESDIRKYTYGVDGQRPAPGFTWNEFADTWSGVVPASKRERRNLVKSARLLNEVRDNVADLEGVKPDDVGIHPHCGVRTEYHNDRTPGAGYYSYHTRRARPASKRCSAVDFHVTVHGKRLDEQRVYPAVNAVPEYRNGGVAVYPWGIHTDHRGYRARW